MRSREEAVKPHPVYDNLTPVEFWCVLSFLICYMVACPAAIVVIAFTGDDPDSLASKIRTRDPYGHVDPLGRRR